MSDSSGLLPPPADADAPAAFPRIHRVEVWPAGGEPDPRAEAAWRVAAAAFPAAGIVGGRSAAVYLLEAELADEPLERLARGLLADPVVEHAVPGAADAGGAATLEVHFKPGVMDPTARSTAGAAAALLGLREPPGVRTGVRYDFDFRGEAPPPAAWSAFAAAHLGNPVVQEIHTRPLHPAAFAHPGGRAPDRPEVPLRGLDAGALATLSRSAHLFLSGPEMAAVQHHFERIGREPSAIELETIAQTWSEHCVHKTLKSRVTYAGAAFGSSGRDDAERAGFSRTADGEIEIDNLLKRTVAAATFTLRERRDDGFLVSVFDDNAGIVKLDEQHGVAIKVETHNHPSAIEPYGGAATGIGGCIRDILGTGLVADPLCNTDVFAVAPGDTPAAELPAGVIAPARTLERITAGVRDYGNRMGIPTINGAVLFHRDYVANPLVFAGCVGLIPLDKCFGAVQPGDRIVALGGRTGRDGIHGATFSSAELTDTHAEEFGHAVQIGNPITQKQVRDLLLRARDAEGGPLFSAITDCGAGGFSSAIGEMGEKVGCHVDLSNAPTKYAGMSPVEVWISEAQERMVLSVPPEKVAALQALADEEGVELSDLGAFGLLDEGNAPLLRLSWGDMPVGELPMSLLHDGVPSINRGASWTAPPTTPAGTADRQAAALRGVDPTDTLLKLLAHPNIASKHRTVRQYDHEVQARTVVKPLTGPVGEGHSDAAVIRAKPDAHAGFAIGCGVAPWYSEKTPGGDSYTATLHAIDEAVRNVVCTGGDPGRTAILDNFCWPSCDDPDSMGSLVRAAVACHDGAIAHGTPFVSGKDSLHNQFTTEDGELIAIPPTLLVTALSLMADVRHAVTTDAKEAGNVLLLVEPEAAEPEVAPLAGTHLAEALDLAGDTLGPIPPCDPEAGHRVALAVAAAIATGRVRAAHDASEGGVAVAVAEMLLGAGGDRGLGADLPDGGIVALFGEAASRYVLEVAEADADLIDAAGVRVRRLGVTTRDGRITLGGTTLPVADARAAWRG
ncbi:AIR synthase-related protein [Phycisphaera mikurensis]|uniref:AIR synthase-related protein n=1 Tax=Phycisphaera mikurensis TaxID=547188 RepID=UPI00069D8104|nr:AIR synthase-related protein [Phycisphaera mikurensis]MBB6442204.1 phosphoribosylformylglycinamidine synthase [Phycisphaera mikurensis]